MPKIAILTIGFTRFAVPPKVDAAKLLSALSQCEQVKHAYHGNKEVDFPASDSTRADLYEREMHLAYVDSRQLLPRNPAPSEDEGGPLRLEG